MVGRLCQYARLVTTIGGERRQKEWKINGIINIFISMYKTRVKQHRRKINEKIFYDPFINLKFYIF